MFLIECNIEIPPVRETKFGSIYASEFLEMLKEMFSGTTCTVKYSNHTTLCSYWFMTCIGPKKHVHRFSQDVWVKADKYRTKNTFQNTSHTH